jgi:hypothetical protein
MKVEVTDNDKHISLRYRFNYDRTKLNYTRVEVTDSYKHISLSQYWILTDVKSLVGQVPVMEEAQR